MGYISVLNKYKMHSREAVFEDFYTDLNLYPIIEQISKVWGESVKKFYNYFPESKEATNYRRAVFVDFEKCNLYEEVLGAYSLMRQCNELAAKEGESEQRIRREIMHVNEIALYCDATEKLQKALNFAELQSEGMQRIRTELNLLITNEEYIHMRDIAYEIREALKNTKIELTYEKKRVFFKENAESSDDYENALKSLYPDNTAYLQGPFGEMQELDGIERELMVISAKKHPEVFQKASKMAEKYVKFAQDFVTQFFEDVPFFLSFIKFERFMTGKGAHFCVPTENDDDIICADELYDLALYTANIERGGEVVSNDFRYNESELFFVLTGPNQGGKTTFARSLGQLIYFAKLGVKVPAKSANVHYFDNIVTHFSVEESVETGRGKLMEELVRLSPMMKSAGENCFVVINELFTTAANYDACIMGKKVLSHFIANKCHGIYVTHLTELLDSQEAAVGLCAQLDDNGKQTFKILRKVMEYNNCAANQVEKYGLTYEKLKERLS